MGEFENWRKNNMDHIRKWKAEALAKNRCMSEWQIALCMVLERHDELEQLREADQRRIKELEDELKAAHDETAHQADAKWKALEENAGLEKNLGIYQRGYKVLEAENAGLKELQASTLTVQMMAEAENARLNKQSFDYEHWQALAKSNGDRCLALETALDSAESALEQFDGKSWNLHPAAINVAREALASLHKARGGT